MGTFINPVSALPTEAEEFMKKSQENEIKKSVSKKAEKENKKRLSEINGSDASKNSKTINFKDPYAASDPKIKKYIQSKSFMIPFKQSSQISIYDAITDAQAKCGMGTVPRETIEAFILKETVCGFDMGWDTYSDVVKYYPGFCNIRNAGANGGFKNTSASGYMQVVYSTFKGQCDSYPELKSAIAALNMPDTYMKLINNPSAFQDNTIRMQTWCNMVRDYPLISLYSGVITFRQKLSDIGVANKTAAINISADQYAKAVKRYYGSESNVANEEYCRNHLNAIKKVSGESIGEVLKNGSQVSPETISTESNLNRVNISLEQTSTVGSGNITDDNFVRGDYIAYDPEKDKINLTYDTAKAAEDYQNLLKRLYKSKVDITGIIGMPVRFSRYADARIGIDPTKDFSDNDKGIDRFYNIYGRVYTETFIKMSNIVALSPGVPDFLMGFSSEQKQTVMKNMLKLAGVEAQADQNTQSTVTEKAKEDIKNTVNNAKRVARTLYGFKQCSSEYGEHCRRLIYVAAALFNVTEKELREVMDNNEKVALGITDENSSNILNETGGFDAIRFDSSSRMAQFIYRDDGAITDIQKMRDSESMGVFNGARHNTLIYNSGPIENTESISNSTRASSFESMFNVPQAELIKDASFLMAAPIASIDQAKDYMNNTSGLGGLANSISNVFGLSSISSMASKVFANIKIPKVFGDSSYSKQYNIKVKLSSPSGSKMAKFKYIVMPLMRLMPYFLPRQYGYYPDAIISPYLVQTYCKGLIACELGMVSQVQIERNVETAAIDGIPTELDITFTITELNPFLSIPFDPKDTKAGITGYWSSGVIPYLSTMAGIPLYRGEMIDSAADKFKNFKLFGGTMLNNPRHSISDHAANMSSKAFMKLNAIGWFGFK